MKQPLKFAYVIPTKDRPDDMRKLLTSLQQQTAAPDQIVVVDGSDPDIEFVIKEYPDLGIDYVRVFPPSLAKQRNEGMAVVRDDIDIAGYLDDDLVLEPTATEKMKAFWQSADDSVGGASFSILNQPLAFSNRLARLFLLDDPRPGKMLRSGFQSQIPPIFETVKTDWLYGGATLWRRSVIEKFKYDEWYIGHGYLEDVDYSYRVSREYQLYVVGGAAVNHYTRPIRPAAQYVIGKQQVVNRNYLVKKLGQFSTGAFAWAVFGQFLLNLGSSIRRRNADGLRRCFGNLAGLMSLVRGSEQINVYYK